MFPDSKVSICVGPNKPGLPNSAAAALPLTARAAATLRDLTRLLLHGAGDGAASIFYCPALDVNLYDAIPQLPA